MENTGYIELAYIPLILDEQSRVRSPPQFRTEGRFKAFKESLTFDFRPERGFTAISLLRIPNDSALCGRMFSG